MADTRGEAGNAVTSLLGGNTGHCEHGGTVGNRDLLPEKWIDALFERFARIWPEAWTKRCAMQNLDDLVEEWRLGLRGITGEQIKVGIDYSRENHVWPPSIAEFRAACRQHANAEQRAHAAMENKYRRERERLALPSSKVVGNGQLQQIKKLLEPARMRIKEARGDCPGVLIGSSDTEEL